MIIYIREQSGKTTAIKADPADTTQAVRIKIMQKGISMKDKDLMYFDVKLVSTKRLSDYGIKHMDTLYLKTGLLHLGSSGFLLSVAQPSGGVVKVVVNDFDCVVDVKQELAREGGPEVPKQRLKAGGVEMHNEKRLRDYGITGEAVIWMESADDIEKKEREARIIKTIKNKKIRKILGAVIFLIIFIIILIWAYAKDKIKLNVRMKSVF
ncbi:uncharacterized protein LOC122257498 isoform X2 [Penaeus japonicus]|uniref:uncharacterized protein LOC122257498 isoform X2 n=1 Tax=Penaeus japonicus TaxID=27405 RepID=UPI001C70E404|nr:uncharacterized protein LOC122257498 isoform X2 [Penaeus japonicus]XP_042878731.1 uncharacterized protein LOC122257498 isoform X2 [Penaeus japonicus]XP_042878732.1 uncharacterized protein LOC122257498 isoform X2 [Penaeus japonicus]XP_042878733.1 uncharacterized protein LOC122257498 isoform X2 [Penaeus japonicus]